MSPGRPKPPLFFMSGVSYAVSVALITLISIALLAVVFMFGGTYVQSQSINPSISIVEARILSISPGVFLVRVTVGNPGSVDVAVGSISLDGAGCSTSPNIVLRPGQTYSATFTCSGLTPHQRYVVRVSGSSQGKNVGDMAWVVAEA